jgi:hypothetical protein
VACARLLQNDHDGAAEDLAGVAILEQGARGLFHPDIGNACAWRDVETVIWATGYRMDVPWLDRTLLDRRGWIRHEGGVMAQPGMYVLGLPLLRRRSSSFILGLEQDAVELADHLLAHLASVSRAA